jgi:hypothetical protein
MNAFGLFQLAENCPFTPVFAFFFFPSPAMQLKKAFNWKQNC